MYPCRHDTLPRLAAASGSARACTTAVTDLLAGRAPGLLRVPCGAGLGHVLLDGTLTECDRVGDNRADHSPKHHRRRVNMQVVTDPDDRPGHGR